MREQKLGVGGGEQLNKVQTEVDFVEESCELLAVDGCIKMFDGMD